MKHRKLLSTLIAASMTISVVGNVAPAVFADTIEDSEEIVVTDEEEETEEASDEIIEETEAIEETDSEIVEETDVQEEAEQTEADQEIAEESSESEAAEEISESEIVEETVESSAIANDEIINQEPVAENIEAPAAAPEAGEVPEVNGTDVPAAAEAEQVIIPVETEPEVIAVPEEPEVEPESVYQTDLPLFYEEKVVDGILVTVKADRGVFPVGSYIAVTPVYDAVAEALVDQSRDENINVAYSMTFDITIYNAEGIEIEPDTSKGNVYVSFKDIRVADNNLDVDVYHITDNKAVELTSEVDEDTVVAITDGFSYYTVEFTYNSLEYVLDGDSTVALSVILDAVGLEGEVSAVSVSDERLFYAYNESGVWYICANQAFNTEEWMKVTIAGTEYEIVVTDDNASAATVAYYARPSGYDIQGVNPTIQTTYANAGYKTQMSVEGGRNVSFSSFEFGREYGNDDIKGSITASLAPSGNAVIVTYTVTNYTDDAKSVRIGSSADTQVGSDDHAAVSLTSNGVKMRSSNGNEFYLIPGNGDFTTRWTGTYYDASSNVFNNATTYQGTYTDSGLAFSWTIIVPANRSVTRTAVFTAGNNLTTYSVTFDANSGDGTMNNATFISEVPGSLPECGFTKEGYTFMGWAESANSTTVAYEDQAQTTLTSNITLYAVWLESAVVTEEPTAPTTPEGEENLVYTGEPQPLLANPGTCEHGEMWYSIDSVTWSNEIPTRTNAGTYTVYYRAHGDGIEYGDSEIGTLTVTIGPSDTWEVTDSNKPTVNDEPFTGEPLPLVVEPEEPIPGTVVEYKLDDGTWTPEIPTVEETGHYVVYVRYRDTVGNHTEEILEGDPIVVIVSSEREEITYTGNPIQLIEEPERLPGGYEVIEYSIDGGRTWVRQIPTGTNAGDYEIITRYIDTDNEITPNPLVGNPVIVTINPVPAPDPETLEEDQIPTATSNQDFTGDEMDLVEENTDLPENYDAVYYSIDGGRTWTTEIPSTNAAGKFVINVKYVDSNGNHEEFRGEDIIVNVAIPKNPTRFGYDFEGWFADEDCTIPFDPSVLEGNETAPAYADWAVVAYTLIEGTDLTVTSGSDDGATFRAVRNRNETTTFSHYTYVTVDEVKLNEDEYSKRSGSIIIELDPDYIAKLTPGEHTIEIFFDDSYSVKTTFVVNAPVVNAPADLPSTGETINYIAIGAAIMFMAMGVTCAVVVVVIKKKEEKQ